MTLALNILNPEIQKGLQPTNKLTSPSNPKGQLVDGLLFQGVFAALFIQAASQQGVENHTIDINLEELVSTLKALINEFPQQEIEDHLSQEEQENLQQILDGLTEVLTLLEADKPALILQGLEQLQPVQQIVQQQLGKESQLLLKESIVLNSVNVRPKVLQEAAKDSVVSADLNQLELQELVQKVKHPVQIQKDFLEEKSLPEKTEKWIGAIQELLKQALSREAPLIQEQKRTTIQEGVQTTQHGIKQTIINTPIFSPMTSLSTDQTLMVPVKTDPPSMQAPLPSVRTDQLTQELPGIFRSQWILANQQGMSQIRVTLFPEHLGHLDIRIASEDGRMVAQLITNTVIAKETLELHINQLKTALHQQGIPLEKIEISQQQTTNSSLFGQNDERSNQQFFQQRDQFHRQKQSKYLLEEEEVTEYPLNGYQTTSINYVI